MNAHPFNFTLKIIKKIYFVTIFFEENVCLKPNYLQSD